MEVRPKRNKPFVCDECGEKISTKRNYGKIIFVNFRDNKKYRNKFCSVQCFDKWKLLNKMPAMSQEPLEEEVKKIKFSEKESYQEEEEPAVPLPKIEEYKKEKPGVKYVEKPPKVKYEKNNKEKKIDNEKISVSDTDTLNLINKKDTDIEPELYGKGRFIKTKEKYIPKNKLKDFKDILNILKFKYRRKDYK